MKESASTRDFAHIVLRPSPRWVAPDIALAVAVTALAHSFLLGGLPLEFNWNENPVSLFLSLPLLLLAVFMVRPLMLLLDARYVIGAHHLYAETGRCSLRKKHIEIPFEDMRGVRYEQSIPARILGFGTIIVWTATAESAAISMRGISDPEWVTGKIRDRIDLARMKVPNVAAPGQDQEIQHLLRPALEVHP